MVGQDDCVPLLSWARITVCHEYGTPYITQMDGGWMDECYMVIIMMIIIIMMMMMMMV